MRSTFTLGKDTVKLKYSILVGTRRINDRRIILVHITSQLHVSVTYSYVEMFHPKYFAATSRFVEILLTNLYRRSNIAFSLELGQNIW